MEVFIKNINDIVELDECDKKSIKLILDWRAQKAEIINST
jgi:hypothetical protein